MNLTILTIVFILVTIIYDLFIPKFNEEAIERIKSRNNSYIVGDFIISIIVFLGITFLFTMVIKNYLVAEQCVKACLNTTDSCLCTINNTLFGVIVMVLQLVNVVNLYQTFVHSYSYFSMTRDVVFKVITAIVMYCTIIAGEIIIASIKLPSIVFAGSDSWLNFLIKILVYGAVIIYPLVVLAAVLRRVYFEPYDIDDEYRPAKRVKKTKTVTTEVIEDLEEDDHDSYDDYYGEKEDITSNYYY